jgi:drug/metabolite transporter (DMT)-like permease
MNVFTFFYAYRHTTIANAVLTHYIAPVIVAFLAPVFLKERLTRRVAVAIVLASIGLYIMVGADAGLLVNYLERPTEQAAGIFSGLFSGLVYAVIVIVFRAYAQSFHPLVLCFSQNFIIGLILLPFVRAVPTAQMGWLVLMGIVNSTIAPILYFRGLESVQANRAAVLGYLEPVGAIAFSMIFLAEFPLPRSIAGGVLILLAGYFTLKAE